MDSRKALLQKIIDSSKEEVRRKEKMEKELEGANISEIYPEVYQYLDDVKHNRRVGFETGFKGLDRLAGLIGKGQVWTIGGISGIGKSYFMVNMVDNFLQRKKRPTIAVFSTELSKHEYIRRLLFKRVGIWKNTFEYQADKYFDKVNNELNKLTEDLYKRQATFRVFGDIAFFEQIEEALKLMKKKPQLVFIDYIQELQVADVYKAPDVMRRIASRLKQLSAHYGITFVVMSQVNLYTQSQAYDGGSRHAAPLSYGKHLNHVSHVVAILNRRKENNQVSNILELNVYKARDGRTGTCYFKIGSGYQLSEMRAQDALEELEEFEVKSMSEDESDIMSADIN